MTTNVQLPDPLVPAEVDLRGYEWMPLFGDRLRNSETWILASAEGKVAAIHLWWNAFAHEAPAGSLPNNDRLLADAAGYGMAVAAWKAVKDEALRGWVLCADGRLYHPFLAELALDAWETRRSDIEKKQAERERKKAKRLAEKAALSGGQTPDVQRTDIERPPDNTPVSAGASAGIPPENALKGQESRGKERSTRVGKSSAGGLTRAPAQDGPPAADGDGARISAGIASVRRGIADAFERWWDLDDRPLSPADEELITDWLAAGTERGLAAEDAAGVVVEEIQRQFQRLSKRDGAEPPRSLRAQLDTDVRTALANATASPQRQVAAAPAEPLYGVNARATWAVWRTRLETFRDKRDARGKPVWMVTWGPKPFEDGCEAPPELVAEILGDEPTAGSAAA
jgi:hypothetical protein